MTIRKFRREELETEPHSVRFKDLYPWEAIAETPFGVSLAIIEPGGRTMLHGHDPAETFVICRGQGTMRIDDQVTEVGPGDVVYLTPRCTHDLTNASQTEELWFVSVFWDTPVGNRVSQTPKLIIPSPPTPNGPLHVGHLSGPYLLADTLRRYYRARGIPATLVCLTDEHQSYVADRAAIEQRDPLELAATFSASIVDTFGKFHATPDVTVHPTKDAAYREAIQARFAKLALEERTMKAPYCETCAMWLYDSYIVGGCPQCKERAYGFACDACCSPIDPAELIEAKCDRCHATPALRETTKLVLPLAPYFAQLADHHRVLKLPPKLRRFAATWLERRDLVAPASQIASWGIPVPGREAHVISPWFEVALATDYLRDTHVPGGDVVCCFGVDNAFLYLLHDPAIALALDPAAKLPIALAVNEHLMLDDAKMSTSRSHVIDAQAILAKAPADLIRLYLAKIRPEETPTSSNLAGAAMFINFIAKSWQDWLARLAGALVEEAEGKAPAAANPSLAPWSQEQTVFAAQLKAIAARARQGYEDMSLREVASAIGELVERATAFGATQQHLRDIASLAGERATGLALELAAARTLALIAHPLMPAVTTLLWKILGFAGPLEWWDDVSPIPPGQPIITQALAQRILFPAWIELS
jgi:methionyl-tRNA synthetase